MASNQHPRRVDFFSYDEDFECAYLAALGRSNKCIIARTKLSSGKIAYRLKKAKIRRLDYRDGTSDIALIVERALRPGVTKDLTKYLKNL
jgi:hypothetical protein